MATETEKSIRLKHWPSSALGTVAWLWERFISLVIQHMNPPSVCLGLLMTPRRPTLVPCLSSLFYTSPECWAFTGIDLYFKHVSSGKSGVAFTTRVQGWRAWGGAHATQPRGDQTQHPQAILSPPLYHSRPTAFLCVCVFTSGDHT